MAPKKENRKMVDMLERMGMIKKVDDDPDAVVSEESAPVSSSAAPPNAAVDVKSAPARQTPPPAAPAPAKARASAPKAPSSRSARKQAPPVAAPASSAPEPVAPAVPEPAAVAAAPATPPPAAVQPAAPVMPAAPAPPPAVPPPAASVPPPVYTPPAAYQPPSWPSAPPPMPPPAPFVQRPPESPAYRAAYISPEAEKNLYAHLSVSNSYAFDNRPAPFEGAPATPGGSLINSFWADTPAVDSTVDRYLDTTELYTNFRMKLSGIDTIYLIEEYMKTLPDSLPAELRRSIIIRIVASSGFDFEKLVNDGIDRVTRLNEYATQFAARTDEVVTRQNAAIEDLERQIASIRAEIDERKNLHKQQFLTIEDEAQRLKEILDFITK